MFDVRKKQSGLNVEKWMKVGLFPKQHIEMSNAEGHLVSPLKTSAQAFPTMISKVRAMQDNKQRTMCGCMHVVPP